MNKYLVFYCPLPQPATDNSYANAVAEYLEFVGIISRPPTPDSIGGSWHTSMETPP